MGLAVSSTNEIFLGDMKNKRIQVFSMKGGFLRSFPTGNMHPTDITRGRNDTLWVTSYLRICVDSLGRVIVADYGNSRVEMFTAEGKHIRTVAYITRPKHVATGGEGQLVVSHQYHFITIYPKY
ncbi:hypothetical protein Bbelb_382310 [Branchiostoma belcheri]|nr:hypothetical protein Bbelb_382310 [Branchiostoma belcheri]